MVCVIYKPMNIYKWQTVGRRGLDKVGRVIILPIEELVEEKSYEK